jgi:hypothetical protein
VKVVINAVLRKALAARSGGAVVATTAAPVWQQPVTFTSGFAFINDWFIDKSNCDNELGPSRKKLIANGIFKMERAICGRFISRCQNSSEFKAVF